MTFLKRFFIGSLTAAALSGWGSAEPARVKMTFLHLNDVYEYTTVDDGRKGSFPRIETLRKRAKTRNPNTLFVLAGDTLSPSVASSLFRGRQMIEMWNAVGLDMSVLGNHEFDFGCDVLKERIKESRFQWLGANVLDKQTGKPFADLPPFVVRDLGGVKVGVFGVLTPDTAESSSAGNEVTFADPVATAREVVAQMRAQGVEYILALTHLTLEEDKALARGVPEINLILGGHEHQPLQSLVGSTPIFKWGSDARILGNVDVVLNQGDHRLVELDWKGISVGKSIPGDARIQALVGEYEKKLNGQLQVPVAEALVPLDGRSSSCRRRETNLGNLVTDALRERYKSDIALITGSAIRIDRQLPVGPISRKSAMMILPYENPLVLLKITGAELRSVLEHSLSKLNTKSSPFPQVSGIRLRFDARRPVGSRITSLEVAGRPVEAQKTYTLTTSEFLHNGGAGFKMLKTLPVLKGPDDAPSDSQVFLEAMIRMKKLQPKLEGRVQLQSFQGGWGEPHISLRMV